MNQKSVIITGITGQIGSYLADMYTGQGHKVYGVKRRTSANSLGNVAHLANHPNLEIVEADLTDLASLSRICQTARPDYFINCAAQSHVHVSFNEPIHTGMVTGMGVLNCLEAIRVSGIHSRFVQLSTSEMFGGIPGTEPQNEKTEFLPKSPYGAAKLYAHHITRIYRQSYKMFASCAICYNNESQRRGPNFVTRKITLGVAAIKAGRAIELRLGNLEAKRDWSYTPDIVMGIDLMLNHNEPDDFIFASGRTHTIREFCDIAFQHADLGDYNQYIKVDPLYYRPCEVDILLGDATKAKEILGWQPKTSFEELVRLMVEHDVSQ